MLKLALLLLFVVTLALATPPKPVWPSKYYITGTYSIPYGNITEPFSFWFDQDNQRQRIDWYYGSEREIDFFAAEKSYTIGPEGTKVVCEPFSVSFYELTSMLPDLTDFIYKGQTVVNGFQVDIWQWTDYEDGNHTYVYNLFSQIATGIPVQFYMSGPDIIFGSHPDIYIIDYATYIPNYARDDPYVLPQDCDNVASEDVTSLWEDWKAKHNRQYKHVLEHKSRFSIWNENKKYIDSMNSKNLGYKLKLNSFADLSNEEFHRMAPPRSMRPPVTSQLQPGLGGIFHGTNSLSAPSSIDWRTKGAVTPVKDQGSCGSCWTFGSIGSVEGIWAIQNGELLRLSEQQIVDCSWVVNLGCNGGYAQWAYQWMISNGGLALEGTYRYLAQNSWCKSYDKSSGVYVTGYKNVTSGDENALKEAVASVGPVAIAIDAAHLSFRFYAEGVYYEPECGNTENDLDHEVLVVGYGTTSSGQDYWIVKNSWSTHWGDEGYVLMARNKGNNCGVATDASFPVVGTKQASILNNN